MKAIRSTSTKVLAVAALLTAGLSACSSSSNSSSTGTPTPPAGSSGAGTTSTATSSKIPAAIQQLADEGTKPITAWPGPTDSPKKAAEPKSIVVVPCAVALEGCNRQAVGLVEAAKVLGWKTTLIDPKNDPNQENAAIDQAITQKADGVFLVSISPQTVSGAIKRANAAGIPVIVAGSGTGTDGGVKHEVSLNGDHEGQLLAARIVADSNGSAKVAMFTYSAVPVIGQRVDGSKKIFGECPGCKVVASQDISGTAGGADLVSLVQSILQAHPDVNVLWAPYDAAAVDMVQAVQQAGKSSSVTVASFNANLQNIEFIRAGKVENIVVGEALEWAGWAAADDFNRLFTNTPLPDNDNVPARILDKTSIPPAGKPWEGDFDFRAEYSKMWGVS